MSFYNPTLLQTSPALILTGSQMQNQAMNNIGNGITNSLNDLSKYKQIQEDNAYQNMLMKHLVDFQHQNKGTENERINPYAMSNGTSIMSYIQNPSQYVNGMTANRAGSIWQKFMQERANIANNQQNMLNSKIKNTAQQQQNIVQNYISQTGDTNKDGLVDIRDLNPTEQTALNSMYGSVANKLLRTEQQHNDFLAKQNIKIKNQKDLINYRLNTTNTINQANKKEKLNNIKEQLLAQGVPQSQLPKTMTEYLLNKNKYATLFKNNDLINNLNPTALALFAKQSTQDYDVSTPQGGSKLIEDYNQFIKQSKKQVNVDNYKKSLEQVIPINKQTIFKQITKNINDKTELNNIASKLVNKPKQNKIPLSLKKELNDASYKMIDNLHNYVTGADYNDIFDNTYGLSKLKTKPEKDDFIRFVLTNPKYANETSQIRQAIKNGNFDNLIDKNDAEGLLNKLFKDEGHSLYKDYLLYKDKH